MAKLFGITLIELRSGVKGEDFERFWIEKYAPLGRRLSWTSHVLKGESGSRVGQYAVLWEIPSVESRDSIFQAGELTEKGKQLLEPDFQAMNAELDTFITGWPNDDYVEIES